MRPTTSTPRIVVEWFGASLGMDGFVAYATRVVRGLAAHADVTVLAPDDERWDPSTVADVARVELVPTPAGGTGGSRTESTAWWYDDALPARLAADAAAGARADAVLAPAFFTPAASPSPIVVTAHDLAFVRRPQAFSDENRALYVDRGRPAAEGADAVLAVSASTGADLVDLWSLDPARVVVTPLGPTIDAEGVDRETARAAAAARLGIGGRFLVVVSPTHGRKNLPLVVREHGLLPDALRAELPLVIVNADVPFVHELLEREGARDTIVTPRLPDDELRDLVAGATALLHGSSSEGFGLPALDAMAAGTPLIANDAPSLNEIAAGVARFVDIHAPGDTAAAIAEVAGDARLAAALGDAGRSRARDYGWASTAERTIDTLVDVARGAPLRRSLAAEAAVRA